MNGDARVLLLEDSPADAELIMRELRRSGPGFVFRVAVTRRDFTRALAEFQPDAILANHTLPGFSGLSALAIARRMRPDTPFIFVTGAMGEEFAVETLHRGAANYVLKGRLFRLAPVLRRALEHDQAGSGQRGTESIQMAQLGHRLRTPLAGILGLVERLASTPLDEEQRRMLATLRDSVESLSRIVKRLPGHDDDPAEPKPARD